MIQTRSISPPPVKAPPPNRAGLQILLGVFVALALCLGFAMRVNSDAVAALFGPSGCRPGASNDRNASTSLKTIASAQFDFQSSDRDWNDVKDFWRSDVAGLYTQYPTADATKTPVKLIELSIAAADDRPVSDLSPYSIKGAKAGYWFRAILHEDEQTPSPERFATCAFPDSPSAGKYTFIVDEQNTIYRKELKNQRGLERYPLDPVKAGWTKLD